MSAKEETVIQICHWLKNTGDCNLVLVCTAICDTFTLNYKLKWFVPSHSLDQVVPGPWADVKCNGRVQGNFPSLALPRKDPETVQRLFPLLINREYRTMVHFLRLQSILLCVRESLLQIHSNLSFKKITTSILQSFILYRLAVTVFSL